MKEIKKVFEDAFKTTISYDDSTPLYSKRHPIFIEGIEVKGEWRDLHDIIYNAFIDVDEDGSTYFISPQHEKEYLGIEKVFNSLFLKLNK